MKVYRHGDVNLIEVSEADYQAARKRGTVLPASKSHVLAKGEATGSVHLLEVESADQMELVQDGETLWLKLTEKGSLTHTVDHEPLVVEPKRYRQVPEREIDHFEGSVVRKVVD